MALLVVVALLCVLVPHPFEGPVVVGLGGHHGIHLSDIFVVLLVGRIGRFAC